MVYSCRWLFLDSAWDCKKKKKSKQHTWPLKVRAHRPSQHFYTNNLSVSTAPSCPKLSPSSLSLFLKLHNEISNCFFPPFYFFYIIFISLYHKMWTNTHTHTQSTHPHTGMYILMHPVISAQFQPPFKLWATRLIHLHNSKGERAATRGTSVERNGWEWVIWCLTKFAFHAKKAMAVSRCWLSQESLLARCITNPMRFCFCPIFL